MLEDMSKDALFYNYYAQWIEVYKKDAIREATMAKYRMTQKWVEKLAPELKVCELTRTAYQKILNDYAKEHERQTNPSADMMKVCLMIMELLNRNI